jgi:hypothetical protein
MTSLNIGEILTIKGRDWVLIETKIGNTDKFRPDLILLETLIKGINRKSYFKHDLYKTNYNMMKKTIKANNLIRLTNLKIVTDEENNNLKAKSSFINLSENKLKELSRMGSPKGLNTTYSLNN